METVVFSQSVHNKRCVGCTKTNTDVMITFSGVRNEFDDYFLTNSQAEVLAKDIIKTLKQNGYPTFQLWESPPKIPWYKRFINSITKGYERRFTRKDGKTIR